MQKSINWVVDRKKHVEFYPQTMIMNWINLILFLDKPSCSSWKTYIDKNRMIHIEDGLGSSKLCRMLVDQLKIPRESHIFIRGGIDEIFLSPKISISVRSKIIYNRLGSKKRPTGH